MKTIAFFNNKGGVGKTTLACNISAMLSKEFKNRVLLMDLDPQCNSTQLILGLEACNEIYGGLHSKEGVDAPSTIYDALSYLVAGDIKIDTDATPLAYDDKVYPNRFDVDLYLGDPSMALFENILANWWAQDSDVSNLRKTNWLNLMCHELNSKYDFLIIDVGPSLGALNRSIMLNVDYFITPLSADTFSIMALKNISAWMVQWRDEYAEKYRSLERKFSNIFPKYVMSLASPEKMPSIAGYSVQQYIAKKKQGIRRPTLAYEKILDEIPDQISTAFDSHANNVSLSDLRLGDVPALYSLIPLAQSANAPIMDLKNPDGLNGAQYAQQREYVKMIRDICQSLLKNLEIGV